MGAPDDNEPSKPGSRAPAEPKGGPPMPLRAILEAEIEAGMRELHRPRRGLLLSGLSAGLDIGFGPLLIGVVLTMGEGIAEAWLNVLRANAYAIGFVFVVMGRSELFTEHTTLAAMPVLDGRASVVRLLRLWGLVYVANLGGSVIFAAIGALVATSLGVIDRQVLVEVAQGVVHHDLWVIALSGVLAGWLMGLLSWLLRASQDTIGQITMVWLVTGAIGLAHLHHCIAGSVEVLLGVFATGGADVGIGDYLRFLVPATLGNAVGGVVFVAAVKLGHARRPSDRE